MKKCIAWVLIMACTFVFFACDGSDCEVIPFSYSEHREIYVEDTPCVNQDSFVNTSESNIFTGNDAIERAKNECTVKWNEATVYYDEEEKVWLVLFSKKNVLGGGQSVYMDEKGRTLLIVYGE